MNNARTDEFPVTIEIPIAWGDMDAFQHVNNVVYFKHFESARIAYFETIDWLTTMHQTGIGPILASTQCRYKIPLTYPDTVTVGARVDAIEAERFIMTYVVVSRRHGKAAALGEGTLVAYDYRHRRKTRIPEEIKQRIIRLETQARPDVRL